MNNDNHHDNDELDEDEHFISRTEQKKSMLPFREMGEELLKLNNTQLQTIPMPAELADALDVAKKIKVGNALKRQMSFIGKLIRKNDHESIRSALDKFKQNNALHDTITKTTEQWRERLLTEGNTALSEFINTYNSDERQKLNQLIRSTNKASSPDGASKHKKALFALVRDAISESYYS